jgi:hypothetical protein
MDDGRPLPYAEGWPDRLDRKSSTWQIAVPGILRRPDRWHTSCL